MPPFPATLLSSTTGPYSNLSDAGIGLSVAVEANNCEYSGCKLATVLRKRRRWPQARLPQDLRLARAPAYSPSLVDEDCGRFYSLHVPITSPQPLGVAGQRRGSASKDIGEDITGICAERQKRPSYQLRSAPTSYITVLKRGIASKVFNRPLIESGRARGVLR